MARSHPDLAVVFGVLILNILAVALALHVVTIPGEPEYHARHVDTTPHGDQEHLVSHVDTTPHGDQEHLVSHVDTKPVEPENLTSHVDTKPGEPEHRSIHVDTKPGDPEHHSRHSDTTVEPENLINHVDTKPVEPEIHINHLNTTTELIPKRQSANIVRNHDEHCRNGYIEIHGECFYYSHKRADRNTALIKCEAMGAQLAHVENLTAFMDYTVNHYRIVKPNGRVRYTIFWIGGYIPVNEERYKWVDGTPIEQTIPWGRGNPSGNMQTCLTIGYNGAYDDDWCCRPRKYVCSLLEVK